MMAWNGTSYVNGEEAARTGLRQHQRPPYAVGHLTLHTKDGGVMPERRWSFLETATFVLSTCSLMWVAIAWLAWDTGRMLGFW